MTGRQGAGKTTLCDALTAGLLLPGIRSYALYGDSGLPKEIRLEERNGPRRCVIGHMGRQKMEADTATLDTVAAAILHTAALCPSPWAVIDEIGYLEQASPAYQAALLGLFDAKRIVAVLRKADTPLLCALRGRSDCLVLDLDQWEG